MNRSTKLLACLVGCASVVGASLTTVVHAQTLTSETSSAQNGFTFRPYAWLPFMKGTSSLGANKANIDTNIFEILDKSSALYGFMGYGEYRTGKATVYTDLVWAKINIGTSTVKTANPIAGVTATLAANANVWFDMVVVDSGAAYEIAKWTTGGGGSLKDGYAALSATAIDVVAGVRYWYLRPDIELGVTGTIDIPALGLSRTTGGLVSAAKTIDWADPLVGLRLRHSPAPGQEFVLRADVGGFGVGSEITWQANVGYSMPVQLFGLAWNNYIGYRALYIDYEKGAGARRFGLDLLQHGPVVGVNFKW